MPMYEYECKDCGSEFFKVLPISKCQDVQYCECGGIGQRVFSPAFIPKFFQEWWTPDGRNIRTQAQQRKWLRSNGKEEIGNTSMEQLNDMNKRYKEDKKKQRREEVTRKVSELVYSK